MASKTRLLSKVVDTLESAGVKMELIQHILVPVGYDINGNEAGNQLNNMDARLSYVIKCSLNNSGLLLEPGALHYMHGNLQINSLGGGLGGMIKRATSGESASISEVTGSGEVYLEPSRHNKHFFYMIMNDETFICDRGLFFAGANTLKVSGEMQSNISAALFGGEGLFQTKVSGSGVVIFEMPVPAEEVKCVELRNEILQVDGTFAVMRTAGISFKVEKSSKSKSSFLSSSLSTVKSGEGLLQTFSGTGRVWLAPTLDIRMGM